jgi:hypothetical protein
MKYLDHLLGLASSTKRQGASQASIGDLENWVGKSLPPEYVELMRHSNGIEGFLWNKTYLVLWPIEQVKQLNEAYFVAVFAPGLLLIGSDGSGNSYAFDMRHEPMSVKKTPFIGISHEEAKTVASGFEGFLEYLRDSG